MELTDDADELERLAGLAFANDHRDAPPWRITGVSDANEGRGVFARVVRVELSWPGGPSGPRGPRPPSVVMKLPVAGPTGAAAAASGAYRREAEAYLRLLPRSPVGHPLAYLVEPDDALVSLVLEDLGRHRRVDQLDGLGLTDAVSVASALRQQHDHWQCQPDLMELPIRRASPTTLDPTALAAGVQSVADRWGDAVPPERLRAFKSLLANREHLVERFAAAGPPTLCHGDPRADNLVFDEEGRPVIFDWQQIAVQFGPADLSWLAATSMTIDDRRRGDDALIEAYGTTRDHYRLGFVLPGLAVLLLAQRDFADERSNRFVATSLDRIGAAIDDLAVSDA